MENNAKIFLIMNFSNFGDVLLTNTLCQNIKLEYPDAKVIFIVNKAFEDVARYQKDVDEVYGFKKRGTDKGFIGLIRYANKFPYKNNIFASFVIYGNDRGIILSKLLGAKHIISGSNTFCKYLITNKCAANGYTHMQDINGEFLEALTQKRTKVLPIKVNVPENNNVILDEIKKEYAGKKIVGLTCISKASDKDMPIQTAVEIIKKLNNEGTTPILFGVGTATRQYANNLKKYGCIKFLDLVDVTTLCDLIQILSVCDALISVDTGTMHLACALGVPVVSVFYRESNVPKWAPRSSLYKCATLYEDCTPQNIINKLSEIME